MSQAISELPQTLRHYSPEKMGEIYSVEQSRKHREENAGKPKGLWLADGNAWISEVAQYGGIYDEGKEFYAYDVTLNPEAKILYLDGSKPENFISFCQQYGRFYCPEEKSKSDPGGKGCWYDELTLDEKRLISTKEHRIDWAKVADNFDGIFVSCYWNAAQARGMVMLRNMDGKRYDPYENSLRALSNFAVDSLCVWNKDAVLRVEPAKEYVNTLEKMGDYIFERKASKGPTRPQTNSLEPSKPQHLTAET